MDTLNYILNKFQITFDDSVRMPIEIRDFGREGMAGLFQEIGYNKGVEIGVRGGEYSETLCKAIPGVELYGVDPYTRIQGYRDIVRQNSFDAYEQAAHEKLDKYPNYHFVKKLSLEALDDFADNSLDFVYIDGNHDFLNVTQDIDFWIKKVRVGGIISGDDYFKHKGNARIHVYQAVNGYTDSWHIRPWFVLGTKAILPGEVRDHGRSWMWVKTK
jgi:hypothetical protein